MPLFEIREGNGNDGCYRRGEIEAKDAFDALRRASRTKMIHKPYDVILKRDIDGDTKAAYVSSFVAPIFGSDCRWQAKARLIENATR